MNRRTFLLGGVALTAAPVAWPRAASRLGGRSALYADADLIIVDRNVAGSATFAMRARATGGTPLEFASDVAGLWMREIEPTLRSRPTAIVGYTSAATLFCLDVLARDYGSRLVEPWDDGIAVTWLLSSRPMHRGALAPMTESSWSQNHA